MRNKAGIIYWMINEGIRQVDIAKDLRLKSRTLVCETIAGQRNNRKVLSWLKKKGCPEEFLGLPDDMRRAA